MVVALRDNNLGVKVLVEIGSVNVVENQVASNRRQEAVTPIVERYARITFEG